MYDVTITIFNYRKANHSWYTSVFEGVNVIEHTGKSSTQHGTSNDDNVEIILHADADRIAKAIDGSGEPLSLRYLLPKTYAAAEDVTGCFTMAPECDFVMIGNHWEAEPLDDDAYEEGLYHAMNNEHDGVYMITGTTWYSLLPHFEIGGR